MKLLLLFLSYSPNIKKHTRFHCVLEFGESTKKPLKENKWEGYAITAHLTPKVSFTCWSTFWILNLSHKICILLSAKYAPNRISLVHSRTAVCCFYTGTDGTIAVQKYKINWNYKKKQREIWNISPKYLGQKKLYLFLFGQVARNVYLCNT